jgi:uncharacterized protein YqgC (DUF456 family)
MNDSTTTPSTSSTTARRLSNAGLVCGLLALLVLPYVLGPVGAVLGFTAHSKGDRPRGLYVGIGSVVTTIVGTVAAVVLWQGLD